MLKYPLLVLCVCLALFVTANDASATARPNGTKEASARSAKSVDAKKFGLAPKASATSSVAATAKKSSSKQKARLSSKSKSKSLKTKATKKRLSATSQSARVTKKRLSAQSKSAKARVAKSRKQKNSGRDPDTLPAVEAGFAENPRAVLTVLSTIPTDGEISSLYGMRRLSRKAKRVRMHTGVDIRAERGTPVLAAAPGVVSFVGRWAAYGKIVELDHGNGLITRYAHLDGYTVETGDKVVAGTHIGQVGRTGRTTGAHLHFETLVNGRTVNPMIAEIWQQAPAHLATRGTYVSGLRSRRAYH